MADQQHSEGPRAPAWVAVLAYLVCIPLGAWGFVTELQGEREPVILGITVYLIVGPVLGVSPIEMLQSVFGGRK